MSLSSSLIYLKMFDEMVVEAGGGKFVCVPRGDKQTHVGDRGTVSII